MANAVDKPQPVNISTSKEDSPWWANDISSVLQPSARKMLEQYARIPPDDVINRISQAREAAWQIGPFPSFGGLTWLNPYILLHTAHDTVLQRVKSGATILDCACFISPDLRQLAYEGAPTEKMYGFDIVEDFFSIGFDFYNDRTTFKGKFFAADALRPFSETLLGELEGKVDVIWCPKFLHLYDRAHQIELAARLITLLKPEAGSLFVGSQNGYPGTLDIPIASGSINGQTGTFHLSDEVDIEKMWREVAEKTATRWELEARLLDLRTIGLHVDDGIEYKKRVGYNLQWTAKLVEIGKGAGVERRSSLI